MAVVLLGAALGLFGGGLLSGGEANAGDELTVKYPRFLRAHSPFELTIDWLPRRGEATVWISRAFLDRFEIAEIQPAPSAVTVGRDRINYAFGASEPHARVAVTFRLRAEGGGAFRGRLGSDDDLDVEVRQFAFP